jgi:myo-inositol-1(or 4)-monophosphatase
VKATGTRVPRRLRVLRALAERAARQAGRALHGRTNLSVLSAKGKDIKLAADRRAERVIVDLLRRENDFSILTEEAGEIGAAVDGEPRWIVDPLDGSFNYKRGIPGCCISIALWVDDTPLVGVIYDFARDELFAAIAGEGAWLNGTRIRVSQRRPRGQAVLFTGFPVGSRYTAAAFQRRTSEILAYKKVRLVGSAALSLAYVACGRADAYHEDGIMLWDVAAGLALLQAAGGRFRVTPYGRRRHCLSVRATA